MNTWTVVILIERYDPSPCKFSNGNIHSALFVIVKRHHLHLGGQHSLRYLCNYYGTTTIKGKSCLNTVPSLSPKPLGCRATNFASVRIGASGFLVTDRHLLSSTMPASMHGSNAAFLVQGNYNDYGNQCNVQGTSPGNYSLYLMCIRSDLIY